MANIDAFLRLMKEQGASDLHLSVGSPALLRLNGDMVPIGEQPLDGPQVEALIMEIISEDQKKQLLSHWELDCAYALPNYARYRVNVSYEKRGMAAVLRLIPQDMPTVEQLGIPPQVMDLVDVHKGLVLVTGPTGSGKSTTLAAIINHINTNKKYHIITIEDPIEFVHPNKKCIIHQREVGANTKSFANALRASFREGPEIILVGEMRDLETISLAITAAETGHLVFGTLHTNSAAKTVDRIIDVFPSEEQEQIRTMLSESLRGVIAQTLFKRADKKGRIAALEVLVNTKAVGNLIREGKTFQLESSMQMGTSNGMISFKDVIPRLIKEGKISREDGMEFLGGESSTNSTPAPGGATQPAEPAKKGGLFADLIEMGKKAGGMGGR